MEVNSGIVPTIIANLMLNLAPNLVFTIQKSNSIRNEFFSTKKLKEEKKLK